MKKNDFQELAKHVINGYNEVLEGWQVVIETAKEMDGKVFNKRFTDAVNAKLSAVRCSVNAPSYLGNKELSLWLDNRSYNNGSFCCYFDDKVYYRDVKLDSLLTDGRIDAAKVVEIVNDLQNNINKKVSEWSDAAKNWDRYEKRVRKALAAFGAAMEGVNPFFIPSEIRSYNWRNADTFQIYNR